MKYILAVGLLLIAFAIPGFNIYHHIEIPLVNKERIHSYKYIDLEYPFVHNNTDITLETTIGDPSTYRDVSRVLRDADIGDTITFHLVGFGGRVDSTYLLINQIKMSKAEIIMSVEAPVHSAHAYIASFGDKIIMAPSTYLMFHFSSILNRDCSKETGSDRGVSNSEHCEASKAMEMKTSKELLNEIYLLTNEEKERIYKGYDVYLDKATVDKRVYEYNVSKAIQIINNIYKTRSFFDGWFK